MMIRYIIILLVIDIVVSVQQEKKGRAYDRELSDFQHKSDDSPAIHSDEEEDEIDYDGDHDARYDHDAFLGREDAKEFDHLSPDESKARLIKIVEKKIDTNNDGEVSEDELKNWISFTSKRYLLEDRDKHWKNFFDEQSLSPGQQLSWEVYKQHTFGNESSRSSDPDGFKEMLDIVARDHERWKVADSNNDTFLDKEEFLAFLHPEDYQHMHHLVIQETINDLDKDKDGFIDLKEYINDLWTPKDSETEEPKWVATERENFALHRDLNKDGKLDKDEVVNWILPKDFDHVIAETKHLFNHADTNHDNKLSLQEILEHYDIFVGSQATDFGEALHRKDEL